MIFGRRSIVDGPTADWVLDRTSWLISALGPREFFEHTRLILPTQRYFAARGGRSPEIAQAIFDEVRAHMGVSHWPCRLVPRAVIGSGKAPFAPNAVAGTFYHAGEEAVITYDPRLLAHRLAFIGTMAHELGHYVLAPHADAAPGGDAEHEMLTDLLVVMAGFGVIDMSGARQVGWQGYIDLDTRSFALAVFLRLKELDFGSAAAHLDASLKRRLARAEAQLAEFEDQLSYLRALRPR